MIGVGILNLRGVYRWVKVARKSAVTDLRLLSVIDSC